MMKVLIATVVIGLLILALTGCEVFSPGDDSDQQALREDYGAYTTEDELPGFGDADLLSGYTEDVPFDDEMVDHPAVTNGLRHGRAKVYALRMVWGNLQNPDSTGNDSQGCPVSDWSGSVQIDGGVAIIRRLIRFDPGDYIVRPRPGPKQMAWVSYTKDHVDGILLHIIDVPDPDDTETTNTLTVSTAYYNAVIPLEDLGDYREFVVFDECNKISVGATEIRPARCPRGFTEGAWVAETDTSGHFRGTWIGGDGSLTGYVKGRYTMRDGERVLRGKWITRSGRFGGLIKGTWAPLDTDNGPSGHFEGRWVDETFTIQGFFRGHYCLCEDDGRGFFHARWIKDCR